MVLLVHGPCGNWQVAEWQNHVVVPKTSEHIGHSLRVGCEAVHFLKFGTTRTVQQLRTFIDDWLTEDVSSFRGIFKMDGFNKKCMTIRHGC